jgi:protein TonB
VVEATIGKDGRITDANVVSSPEASLSAAALDAVRQWRYEPYTVNGQPTEIHTRISVGFVP